MDRRDSIKLMVAAAAGLTLPAGDVAQTEPHSRQGADSSGLNFVTRDGAYANRPAFTRLRFGEIKPKGWILAQMRRDLQTGFAGCLDELCHEASSDIFASGRNRPGKSNNSNTANDSWWNGETEGNWRCGHMMQACLTDDPAAMAKATAYVNHILASQDSDGYIGIFSPELRYKGNGELWTQTCLFRGLLAYAEATGNVRVYDAVHRAVDRTLSGYGELKQISFSQHDAMYTDVLEYLHARTGDRKYLDFGLRIYRERPHLLEFHRQPLTGAAFQRCYVDGHGAMVSESMRMPFWFWAATGDDEYLKLGMGVASAMSRFTMPSGAMVSEESVDAPPHPWNVGYEYCAIFERQFSLIAAGQKKGDAAFFQAAEHLWFNAAQGSREPDGSAILYCSPENRLSIHDQIGRRQRFSPTHRQVAVCCCPNATRVAPYFIGNAWMRPAGTEPALAATLYGPCEVKTRLAGILVMIEERTSYPYSGNVELVIRTARPFRFSLWLRNPQWSRNTRIECRGAEVRRAGDFWQVSKEWKEGDVVLIGFDQEIREVTALDGESALQFGPLLYVLPVKGEMQVVKTYSRPEFRDYYVNKSEGVETDLALAGAKRTTGFGFAPKNSSGTSADFPLDSPSTLVAGELLRKDGTATSVELVPMGAKSARLRRVTFPIGA